MAILIAFSGDLELLISSSSSNVLSITLPSFRSRQGITLYNIF